MMRAIALLTLLTTTPVSLLAQTKTDTSNCDALNARYLDDVKQHPTKPFVGPMLDSLPEPVDDWEAIWSRVTNPSARRVDVPGVGTGLAFFVDEKGDVQCATVTRSVFPDLDQEILHIIQRVKFEPARRGGEAVLVKMSALAPFAEK